MRSYEELIRQIPEFSQYDVLGYENYVDIGISPLGTLGQWLNELCENTKANQQLLKRICEFLNHIYLNPDKYADNVVNDICVSLFWALDYSTIKIIKPYLRPEIISDGREYLKVMDGENFEEF